MLRLCASLLSANVCFIANCFLCKSNNIEYMQKWKAINKYLCIWQVSCYTSPHMHFYPFVLYIQQTWYLNRVDLLQPLSDNVTRFCFRPYHRALFFCYFFGIKTIIYLTWVRCEQEVLLISTLALLHELLCSSHTHTSELVEVWAYCLQRDFLWNGVPISHFL